MTGVDRRRRRAFTLLEISAVLVLLGVLSLVGAATLLAAVRVHRGSASVSDAVTILATVADRFRADVGGAAAAPDRGGDVAADPERLLLTIPDGGAVTWRFAGGRLTRSSGKGPGSRDELIGLGPDPLTAEFSRQGRLVTLRLWDRRGAVPRFRAEISAALGGDNR